MIRASDTIRGDKIGKRANDWYVYVVCPKCLKKRWVLKWKLKLPNFTGLCQLCNAGKHPPQIPHGDKHPRWNGGQTTSRGYVYISACRDHPARTSKGYVKRARLVLEEKLGRFLLPDCIPHHINGSKHDDRPSNLIELTKSQHTILHAFERRLVARANSLGIKEVVGIAEPYLRSLTELIVVSKNLNITPTETTIKNVEEIWKVWRAKLKEWGIRRNNGHI